MPPGSRPTTDRVREAVFSSLGDVTGRAALDLFAGSGALAIEALSRGAARALLVDRDRAAVAACRANLETAGFDASGRVHAGAVTTLLRGEPPTEAPFDLVFIDPPYGTGLEDVVSVVASLSGPGWLAPGARVVVERSARGGGLVVPAAWDVAWERKYGDTLVAVLRQPE